MTRQNKDLLFALVVTLVFAGAAFYIIQFHEPWMDEAQAWLVARDNGISGIIEQMSFEGQPPLWHFILYPLAHLGLPIESMQILHVVISSATVFFFIRFSPFTKPFKLLFVSSYMMFYEYTIVSRSYSLSVLLLFAIASMYKWRFEKPWAFTSLIALLAWSNNLGLLAAAALGGLFLLESIQQRNWRERLWHVGVMVGSGVLAWYVSILDESSFFHTWEPNWEVLYISATDAFFVPALFKNDLFFIAPLILIFFILSFLKTQNSFLFLWVTLSGLMYILVYRWPGEFRHWTFMLILIVFTYWISSIEERVEWKYIRTKAIDALTGEWGRRVGLWILMAVFFVSAGKTAHQSIDEIKKPFSNSRAMGEYISEHIPEEQIAGYKAALITSIIPYIPQKEIYFLQFQRWGSFQTESSHYGPNAEIDGSSLEELIEKEFKEKKPWLLFTVPITDPESVDYEYVFETTKEVIGVNQEKYYLYKPK